jgi:hypothetical protein
VTTTAVPGRRALRAPIHPDATARGAAVRPMPAATRPSAWMRARSRGVGTIRRLSASTPRRARQVEPGLVSNVCSVRGAG